MRLKRFSMLPNPPDPKSEEFRDKVKSFSTASVLEFDQIRNDIFLDLNEHEQQISSLNNQIQLKIESIDVYENGSMIGSKKKLNFKDGTLTSADVSLNGDILDVKFDYTGWTSLNVQKAGSSISNRKKINFIDGSNVSVSVQDDQANDRTNITISATVPTIGLCRCYRTAVQSIPVNTETVVTWQGSGPDTNSFWSSSNPTRITIPSGFTKARLIASVNFASGTPSGRREVKIKRGGSTVICNFVWQPGIALMAACDMQTTTGIINVSSGDYFEVFVLQNDSSALNLGGGTSGLNGLFFSLEAYP